MSAPRRPDALARVAQARADAEHSLEVLRARRERWGERLQRLPWWGVLLGGFAAGAVAGRVFGRVLPRRETLRLLATLRPLWQRAASAIPAYWMQATAAPARAPDPPSNAGASASPPPRGDLGDGY